MTVVEIQKAVAAHYGTRIEDMTSARRARVVARPRQVAMYLAKRLTKLSLTQIGREFAKRDHTTIWHAHRAIRDLASHDPKLAADIAKLTAALSGAA